MTETTTIVDPYKGEQIEVSRVTYGHIRDIMEAMPDKHGLKDRGISVRECNYHLGHVPSDIANKLPNKCYKCVFCVIKDEGEELEEEYGTEDASEFYYRVHVLLLSSLTRMGVFDLGEELKETASDEEEEEELQLVEPG